MRGQHGDLCATPRCKGWARHRSTVEALQLPPFSWVPFRCLSCCEDIAARFRATGLIEPLYCPREGVLAVIAPGLVLAVIIIAAVFAVAVIA